jgi:hypothetical protein
MSFLILKGRINLNKFNIFDTNDENYKLEENEIKLINQIYLNNSIDIEMQKNLIDISYLTLNKIFENFISKNEEITNYIKHLRYEFLFNEKQAQESQNEFNNSNIHGEAIRDQLFEMRKIIKMLGFNSSIDTKTIINYENLKDTIAYLDKDKDRIIKLFSKMVIQKNKNNNIDMSLINSLFKFWCGSKIKGEKVYGGNQKLETRKYLISNEVYYIENLFKNKVESKFINNNNLYEEYLFIEDEYDAINLNINSKIIVKSKNDTKLILKENDDIEIILPDDDE